MSARELEAAGLIQVSRLDHEDIAREVFVDVRGYVQIEALAPRTLNQYGNPFSGPICQLSTPHGSWEVRSHASDLAARIALARGATAPSSEEA